MGGVSGLRILGIDPGTMAVGYGCLEIAERAGTASVASASAAQPLALTASNVVHARQGPGRVRVVDSGVLILGKRSTPLPERLGALRRQFTELLDRFGAQELSLEEAFFGKSVASALRIGEARGVIIAAAHERGLAVHQFAPARIKRSVAGHGAASKAAVARLVCRQLGLAEVPEPADVTDALAAALCRVEDRRLPFGA